MEQEIRVKPNKELCEQKYPIKTPTLQLSLTWLVLVQAFGNLSLHRVNFEFRAGLSRVECIRETSFQNTKKFLLLFSLCPEQEVE